VSVGAFVVGASLGAMLLMPQRFGVDLPDALSGDVGEILAFACASGSLILGVLVWQLVLVRAAVARENARLAAIPFPFSHEGYVRGLVSPSSSCVLDLHVRFVQAPDRERLFAAIVERDTRATVRWEGPTYAVLSSPIVQTHFTGNKGKGYSNAAGMHEWLVQRALPLLLALHGQLGVASVGVDWH
jgi:hypothetical protein